MQGLLLLSRKRHAPVASATWRQWFSEAGMTLLKSHQIDFRILDEPDVPVKIRGG
jgi:hypothetical protein